MTTVMNVVSSDGDVSTPPRRTSNARWKRGSAEATGALAYTYEQPGAPCSSRTRIEAGGEADVGSDVIEPPSARSCHSQPKVIGSPSSKSRQYTGGDAAARARSQNPRVSATSGAASA